MRNFATFANMFRKVLTALAAALSLIATTGTFAHGQTKAEYERYMDSTMEKSVLYRGKQANTYAFRHNGHPYWYGTDFCEGEVTFNCKEYSGISLNLDACAQELVLELRGKQRAVVLATEAVDGFRIGSAIYLNLEKSGIKGAARGYYEVLCESPVPVYRRVDKDIAYAVESQNGKGIGYYDPLYQDNVYDYFRQKVSYFTVKNGALTHIGKNKALKYAEGKK